MAGLESVLEVSDPIYDASRRRLTSSLAEDFGLMLASYGIARVIQAFPNMGAVPGDIFEKIGEEQQHLTLILSNADGCRVLLEKQHS